MFVSSTTPLARLCTLRSSAGVAPVSYTHLLYERLSRDDNLEGESYSIGNQKKLLTKVAKEMCIRDRSNAIKYRKDNLQVEFSARAEKNTVSLFISDNGIGISAADLPRVFEKGFTGENGRRSVSYTHLYGP